MTREEKEYLLREAVDIIIKLDNHLMTSRDNAEFSSWVEDLIDSSCCVEREQGNDILDEIRTEIEEQVSESLSDGGDDWFAAEKVNECLEIIDKYREERSSEE